LRLAARGDELLGDERPLLTARPGDPQVGARVADRGVRVEARLDVPPWAARTAILALAAFELWAAFPSCSAASAEGDSRVASAMQTGEEPDAEPAGPSGRLGVDRPPPAG